MTICLMSRVLDLSLTAAPTAVTREIEGNCTIYDKGRDRVTVLNGSATAIWRLCDGRSGQAIVDELTRHYAGDPAQMKQDVEDVLERLASSGLLIENETLT